MEIRNLEEGQYVDLFADNMTAPTIGQRPLNFGSSTDEPDLFANSSSSTDQTTTSSSTTDETTKSSSSATDETTKSPEPDLFDQGDEKGKPGRKPKNNFSDIVGYFEDRLKTGKFVAIEEDNEDGTKKRFIPQTPDEFDEVIDIQVNYKLDQAKKEMEEKWYKSKSPAWQLVAQYAEMADSPEELLPMIEGVKSIDSVSSLDPSDLSAAEKIVRTRLERRGDSQDIIDEQLEALKSTDKLVATAQKYKPLILQEEQAYISRLVQQKNKEQQEYQELISNIRDKAIESIEAPLFGKQKLTKEEKAIVYDMIAVPSEETKGYKIYSAIDSLFQKGDFDTLKQISLLLNKKESFLGYLAASTADKVADGLQRKLRVANDSRSGSSAANDNVDSDQPVVNRTRFSMTPKFGR